MELFRRKQSKEIAESREQLIKIRTETNVKLDEANKNIDRLNKNLEVLLSEKSLGVNGAIFLATGGDKRIVIKTNTGSKKK